MALHRRGFRSEFTSCRKDTGEELPKSLARASGIDSTDTEKDHHLQLPSVETPQASDRSTA